MEGEVFKDERGNETRCRPTRGSAGATRSWQESYPTSPNGLMTNSLILRVYDVLMTHRVSKSSLHAFIQPIG
jgi:hypothetical protein